MVKEEVFESLKTELQAEEGELFNESLLQIKVEAAYREVVMARNYPSSYSEISIDKDMEQFYSTIRKIALFDYNQSGAAGQSSYSSDGTSIHYVNRDSYFKGVLPIARC